MKKGLTIVGVIVAVIVVIVILMANKTCVVTFDTSGGTIYASENVKCGEKVKQPADPVLEGYRFTGWYDLTTGKDFDFNTPIEKDITIKARYEK